MASINDRFQVLRGSVPREGGLSRVLRGVDLHDGSAVAIKCVKVDADELLQRRVFDVEVGSLSSLSHPNIVVFRDAAFVEARQEFVIVLEWIEQNLDDVLEAQGAFAWRDLLSKIAVPLTEAIAYAHLKGVQHRDIKPSNILVTEGGIPKLADFGISKNRSEQSTSNMTLADFRSSVYAPPEFEATRDYVRDVYSLGVLFVRCMNSEPLRSPADVQHALASIDVPPDARRLLSNCIAIDPEDRPENGSVLLSALHRLTPPQGPQGADLRIFLRLTNSAVEQLLPGGVLDRAAAAALVQRDLSHEAVAYFRLVDH